MKKQMHVKARRGRFHTKFAIVLAILALAALGTGATAMAKSAVGPPAKPSWVRDDGTIDMAKMPTRLPVVGSNGQVITDAAGDPVTEPTPSADAPTVTPPPSGCGTLSASVGTSCATDGDPPVAEVDEEVVPVAP